ncbi:VacJ family lipoprotein [Luteimonas vadosa]|uniref:VacJ family lipoprotein n=2 Tax=Luteimonas vadosa TaxID=1165507 RepID=A0ABP9DQI5_9GAMM
MSLLLCALLLAGCAGQTPRDAATQPALVDGGALAADADVDARGPATGLDATSSAEDAAPAGVADAEGWPAESQAVGDEAPSDDPRTQAERDFAAIYGATYDPVADPTLPQAAVLPSTYDPWEPLNRRVHAFNNAIDRRIATPLARAYVAAVPRPVRLGVSNFFNNLGQPVSAINALLQGKPVQASASLARFLVNATVGVAGVFDPATRMNIPNRSEDFGQTLGVWGWETSRYVELPLFGPRTVRDVFGLVGDAPLSPVQQVDNAEARFFLQGLQLVDLRTQLFAIDSMREGATDEYALFRDSWMQRRQYQIFGDRMREGDESLPDYLREDQSDTTVPVDVMPIVPGGG